MNFFYQLYYSLQNFVLSPFRSASEAGEMPPHTRGLLLGAPAVFVAVIILATTVWAQFGSNEALIAKYEAKTEEVREQARQVITLLRLRKIISLDDELPIEISDQISDRYEQMTDDELAEVRDELLSEWEIYLFKLIKLDPTEDEYKLELAESANAQGKSELFASLIRELAPADAPGNKKAQLAMGTTYAKRSIFSLAVVHFQNALQSDPDYHQARYQLAKVFLRTEEYQRSLEEIDRIFDDHLLEYPDLVGMSQLAYQKTNNTAGKRADAGKRDPHFSRGCDELGSRTGANLLGCVDGVLRCRQRI